MVIAVPEPKSERFAASPAWCAMVMLLHDVVPAIGRRMRDAKPAGDLSDACSLAYSDASCPQALGSQRSKTDTGVDAGCDEALSNRLNMKPMLLRDLHLSQTVRVVGHKRRKRCLRGPCRERKRMSLTRASQPAPGRLSPPLDAVWLPAPSSAMSPTKT